MAADSRNDRMTIWMKNVEKVVEDAKQNFAAASAPQDIPLPPLPLPLSRDRSQTRPTRLPRRVLAASQIFQADENGNITPMPMDQSMNNSAYLSATDISRGSILPPKTPKTPATPAQLATPEKQTSPLPVEGNSQSQLRIPEIYTPSRQRRATVSTGSPGQAETTRTFDLDIEGGSPSKRKEKSRSHGNLFQRHIAPLSLLEAELNKVPPPAPTPRLSQVIDRSLIIAPPLSSRDNLLDFDSVEYERSRSFDELTSSPLHVEPYPQRPRASHDANIPDTPSRHRIEGVYDRFLMATSGVKRLGKGYQSDNIAPVGTSHTMGPSAVPQHKGRLFHSTRRPMPPPVSSEDQPRPNSVDELGVMVYADLPAKDEGNATVSLVRKAFKLMAPKASASRRVSRMA
ncbi:hypothetical protein BDN70DRAFT_318045 [Pholiota conissans]|uniref:Uncharacterized protein n=1 Tax=Pholiota conissans TaxID=109636 RepID=A0A9P6CWX0_9AGAR|nr:hypothetical protein BDN70DRAFT_318045 [Pholiota conissans]